MSWSGMTCSECARIGDYDGEFEPPAEFRLAILWPPGAVEENPPLYVCDRHATQGAMAFIGFGWSVMVLHADHLREENS